jgi:hypothetical protein
MIPPPATSCKLSVPRGSEQRGAKARRGSLLLDAETQQQGATSRALVLGSDVYFFARGFISQLGGRLNASRCPIALSFMG